MTAIVDRTPQGTIHPFHAVVLAGTIPLFLGAFLADYAFWSSDQAEWSTFASRLIAGGLVFGTVALLCAIGDLYRAGRHGALPAVHVLVLLATWALGFVNVLIHAGDASSIMPTALVLSAIVTVLACAATWMGFSGTREHAAD